MYLYVCIHVCTAPVEVSRQIVEICLFLQVGPVVSKGLVSHLNIFFLKDEYILLPNYSTVANFS